MKLLNLTKLNQLLIDQKVIGPDFLPILKEYFDDLDIEIYFAVKLLKNNAKSIKRMHPEIPICRIAQAIREIDAFICKNYEEDFFTKCLENSDFNIETDIPESITIR